MGGGVFALFDMQLDYCNIERSDVGTPTIYIHKMYFNVHAKIVLEMGKVAKFTLIFTMFFKFIGTIFYIFKLNNTNNMLGIPIAYTINIRLYDLFLHFFLLKTKYTNVSEFY